MDQETKNLTIGYTKGYFSAKARGIYEQFTNEIDIIRKFVSDQEIIDYIAYRLNEFLTEFLEDFSNDYPVVYWECVDDDENLLPEVAEIIEESAEYLISEVENVLLHYIIAFKRGNFKLIKCGENNTQENK